jgi:hypothetical protein
MPIIADVAAGPAILIFGLIVGGGVLLAIGLVEAIVLWLLKWGTFWRSLRDALIVNVASALVGIVMYVLGTPREVYSGYDPARGGRIYEQFPPTIPRRRASRWALRSRSAAFHRLVVSGPWSARPRPWLAYSSRRRWRSGGRYDSRVCILHNKI